MIRGIHHVAVHVRDLTRMIRFYRDAFGFELGEEFGWSDSEFVDRIVDVPGPAARARCCGREPVTWSCFSTARRKPVSDRPLQPFDKGYTHFCVDVTDIEDEFIRLQGLGMTLASQHPLMWAT